MAKAIAKKPVPKKAGKTATKSNTVKLNFDTTWQYAPAPESKSAATINKQYDLFINGEWQKPTSKKYFDTINPATEEKLSEVAAANATDVDKAVKAARNAYDKVWKKMPAKERAKYIFRIARIMQEKARELAIIETLDGGKPIKESRDFDIPTAANHLFYYAGWADKLEYAFPNRRTEPLGVAGQITPWNFPGETDEDFKETFEFLHALDVSYLHVFTYSERDNTHALELKPVVPVSIRNERNKTLRNLSYMKLQYFTQLHSGQTRNVLFEGHDKNGMMEGYTDNYIKITTPHRQEWVNQIVEWTI